RGNARAGVGHGEHGVPVAGFGADVQVPVGVIVAQPVVDEVGDEPLDQPWVAVGRGGTQRGAQVDVAGGRLGVAGGEDLFGESGEVDAVVTVQAGLAAGEGEQRLCTYDVQVTVRGSTPP